MIHDKYAAGDKTRTKQQDYFESNSSGVVLVVVVIFAAVAAILAAGLHMASGSRITQVRQEMRFEKAFFVAEAGIERAKSELLDRATNLSGVLKGFDGVTNTADDGVLSFCPTTGTNYGEGRFYVKVRNNNSENPFVDTDYIVIIRSTGIVETATRVIELEVLVTPTTAFTSMPTQADGALGIYGTNTDLTVNGNGNIDGHDWNVDGTLSTNAAVPGVLYTSTSTVINVTGSGDIDGDPPTTNDVGVYDETYWYQFLYNMMSSATIYTGGDLGTPAAPVITMLPSGSTLISGDISGAGILIIPGDATIKITGTFHYEGLVILEGNGVIDADSEFTELGTAEIYGAMICVGGGLDITATGTADIKYSTQALANLANIVNLPPQLPAHIDNTGSWKEIKASSTNW